MKRILIVIIIVIIVSNLPPVKSFIEGIIFAKAKYYTTKAHGFNDSELVFQGRTYDHVMRRFDNFKKICGEPNEPLYRTFPIQSWKFWLWGEYVFHPKYRLNFMSMPDNYPYNELGFKCKDSSKSI